MINQRRPFSRRGAMAVAARRARWLVPLSAGLALRPNLRRSMSRHHALQPMCSLAPGDAPVEESAERMPSPPPIRLDRLLAERGAGSRKDVDRLLRAGAVELDGATLGRGDAKRKVAWSSVPSVDGVAYPPPPLLAAYHKPLGVVSTLSDERGRPCLDSALPIGWRALHPVGRLDADTSGLLLFCRDGALTHRLLHPRYAVEREYVAEVEGAVNEGALRAVLADGVPTIEDGQTFIARGRLLASGAAGEARSTVRLVVTEGKHRMVRRMLHNAGHPVVTLRRDRYGAVEIGQLAAGESRAVEGDAAAWAEAVLAGYGSG